MSNVEKNQADVIDSLAANNGWTRSGHKAYPVYTRDGVTLSLNIWHRADGTRVNGLKIITPELTITVRKDKFQTAVERLSA